jgi:hypothetical protein
MLTSQWRSSSYSQAAGGSESGEMTGEAWRGGAGAYLFRAAAKKAGGIYCNIINNHHVFSEGRKEGIFILCCEDALPSVKESDTLHVLDIVLVSFLLLILS